MPSWSPSPDWLNANEWTSYPFTEDNEFSGFVVDGQISILTDVGQTNSIVFTKVTDSGIMSLEAREGTTTIVLMDEVPSLVTAYGYYQVWEATSEHASVSLVVIPFVGSWSGVSWELVQGAVTLAGSGSLLSVSVMDPGTMTEVEVAGPGDPIIFESGANTSLLPDLTDSGLRVVVNAVYDQESECDPSGWRKGGSLASFGGATPNPRGELRLSGGKNMAITRLPGGHGLQIRNVSFACCDCLDYEEVFEKIKELHEKLVGYYEEYKAVVSDSDDYILRGQSLLNTPVVGDEDE